MIRLRQAKLARRPRRGSVFILVVAILALLALLALTLAFTTQMELEASRNWVDQIQSRFSSVTGVPFFDPNADPDPPIVGLGASGYEEKARERERVLLDLAISPRELARSRDRQSALMRAAESGPRERLTGGSQGRPNRRPQGLLATPPPRSTTTGEGGAGADLLSQGGEFRGALAENRIEDESAKININALLPAPKNKPGPQTRDLETLIQPGKAGPAARLDVEQFGEFIQAILVAGAIEPPVSSRQLAEAILLHRYGLDGKPGVANVDDDGNSERANPYGDGLDNDGDQVIDNPEEESIGLDADGLDNDRDGQADEAGETIVADGLDSDHDGEVDNTDEGMDDPGESSADIRIPVFGDDQPYLSLPDLMQVPGMTREIYDALAPYLTVFSVSQPAYEESEIETRGRGLRQIDPNTASAKEIYEALDREFKGLPDDLIAQFTVNLIDRRDVDDAPSEVELGSLGRTYIGFEVAPVISEVAPYTGTYNRGADPESEDGDGGDDGQFLELYNPYTRPLSVNGWRIEGGGAAIWLTGSVPANGHLVVTDDYNDSTDPTPEEEPGEGSLYGVYGAVQAGDARLVELATFNLPDDEGRITLFNADGVKVDAFAYKDGRLMGSLKRSFQRKGPFARKTIYAREDSKSATPFKGSSGESDAVTSADRAALRLIETFQNQPFRSSLEVVMVPTNYTKPPAAEDEKKKDAAADGDLQEPEVERDAQGRPIKARESSLRFANLYKTTEDNFDSRLVDIFAPGIPRKRPTGIFYSPIVTGSVDPLEPQAQPNLAELKWKSLRDRAEPMFGRVNINTAPAAILAALPGVDDDLAFKVMKLREEWYYGKIAAGMGERERDARQAELGKKWFEALPPQATPRWRSLAELLRDDELWDGLDFMDRFAAVYPFSMAITFHTLSLKVTTANIPTPTDADKAERLPSMTKAVRIIAGDRGAAETVMFQHYGGFYAGGKDGDRDILFGQPASKVADLGKPLLDWAERTEKTLPVYSGPILREPGEKDRRPEVTSRRQQRRQIQGRRF